MFHYKTPPGKIAVNAEAGFPVQEPAASPRGWRLWHGMRFGLAVKTVIFSALIGTVVVTSLTAYFYNGSIDALIVSELRDRSIYVGTAGLRFNSRIDFARNDALFLSKTPPISGIMRARANGGKDPVDGSSEEVWRKRLSFLFIAMLESRPSYFEMQFIDAKDGREIVRVDRGTDGKIRQTPDDSLQSKADRPSFLETVKLAKGEIYVSDIDLNVDFGKLDKPYRPAIRTATPAYDESGKLLGVVVVNVTAKNLFDTVRETVGNDPILYITNQNGDYLHQPDSSRSFGFILGQRYRIQDDLPQLASLYADNDPVYSGNIAVLSVKYLASAKRIYFDPRQPQRYIVVATLTPQSAVSEQITALRNQTMFIAFALLLAGSIAVAWVAKLVVRPLTAITHAATALADGSRDINLGRMSRRNDETGELARAFDAMTREILAREDQLTARAAELARSNQELSQFAYVASHDLQEPLRMVASYLQLLSRRYQGKLDTEADEFIGYAVDGAERMKQLINDLLGYSRVSNAPLNVELVDTGQVADAVVKGLANRIAEAQGEITVDALPAVQADPLMIERLFTNLLENAVKYRSSAPYRIRVACQRQDDFWKFSVTDNGIGIDPSFAKKIFEIFTRLHGRDKYPGTGIGLASCKRIVERHGGDIWVEPSPGGGSIFFFTLPA